MYLLIRNQFTGLNKLITTNGKLYRILRCTAFRKYVNAEDIYTTVIDNDIFPLKMPASWINEFLMDVSNISKSENIAFNQPKLFYAVTLGFFEYFTASGDKFVDQGTLTKEYNEECKKIRDFMIHLWSSARKLKCGDGGWTPTKGVEDPLDSSKQDKKEEKEAAEAEKAGEKK